MLLSFDGLAFGLCYAQCYVFSLMFFLSLDKAIKYEIWQGSLFLEKNSCLDSCVEVVDLRFLPNIC